MSEVKNLRKDEEKQDSTWNIEESDEAKYNFSNEKGVWQPKPEDILLLLEKLAKGGILPLKWTCPGRRPPSKAIKPDDNAEERMDVDGDRSKEMESKISETSAFDFNEPHIDVNAKLTPRRAPGGLGRTPKTEKRVARMDNIMKSLQKQHLQKVAEREARRTKESSSGTHEGRTRLLNFGSSSPRNSYLGASHTPGSPGNLPSNTKGQSSSSATASTSKGLSAVVPSGPTSGSKSNANITSEPLSPTTSEVKAADAYAFSSVSSATVTQKVGSPAQSALQGTNSTEEQKNNASQAEDASSASVHSPINTQATAGDLPAPLSISGQPKFPSNVHVANEASNSLVPSVSNNVVTAHSTSDLAPNTEGVSSGKEPTSAKISVTSDPPTIAKSSPAVSESSSIPSQTSSNQITDSTAGAVSTLQQKIQTTTNGTACQGRVTTANLNSPTDSVSSQEQPTKVSENTTSTNQSATSKDTKDTLTSMVNDSTTAGSTNQEA